MTKDYPQMKTATSVWRCTERLSCFATLEKWCQEQRSDTHVWEWRKYAGSTSYQMIWSQIHWSIEHWVGGWIYNNKIQFERNNNTKTNSSVFFAAQLCQNRLHKCQKCSMPWVQYHLSSLGRKKRSQVSSCVWRTWRRKCNAFQGQACSRRVHQRITLWKRIPQQISGKLGQWAENCNTRCTHMHTHAH